jgi:putative membrane protein
MSGEIKNTIDKVTDTIGGTVGKMGASATTSADGFVENAAIGDMYEIAAGRLALQRARNDHVRHMAGMMIVDHTTSTHHLQAALHRGPPAEPDTRRATMLKHLQDAPDDDFDTTYVDQQVLAHEETVSLMRSYSEGGDNPQLRSLALSTLPVVERHLQKMKELRAAL